MHIFPSILIFIYLNVFLHHLLIMIFLLQKVIQFALQNLCYTSGTSTLSPTSSTSIDKSHLIVELADVKARLRKLQQEV